MRRPAETPEPGPRDVLLSAWFLSRRNVWLMVWHWLSGMVTTGLAVGTAIVVVIALLVPLAEYDVDTIGGLLGYVLDVISRVQRPGFVIPLLGILTTAFALTIAVTSVVQAGVYGRLAHALEPDGQRAGFWRCAMQHFGTFVGYTAVRLVLELAIAGVGVAVCLVPLLRGMDVVGRTDQIPTVWAVLTGAGAALTALAWAVVWVWRMVALGPLLLDGRPLWAALGDAAIHLGEHLWGWLRLLGGLLLLAAPIVLVWGSFAAILTAVSARPDLSAIGFVGQIALDTAMGLVASVVFVVVAAAFLVRYALVEGIVDSPPAPPERVARPAAPGLHAPRRPLRFGQPLALPGVSALVVMPMPTRFPSIVSLDDILPPMDPDDLPPESEPDATELDDGWLDVDIDTLGLDLDDDEPDDLVPDADDDEDAPT